MNTHEGKTAEQWHNEWLLEYNGRLQDKRERQALTQQLVERMATEAAHTITETDAPREVVIRIIAGRFEELMAYIDTQPLNCLEGAINTMEKCPTCSALALTKELRGFMGQFDTQYYANSERYAKSKALAK